MLATILRYLKQQSSPNTNPCSSSLATQPPGPLVETSLGTCDSTESTYRSECSTKPIGLVS